jgi:hypothetical protein
LGGARVEEEGELRHGKREEVVRCWEQEQGEEQPGGAGGAR